MNKLTFAAALITTAIAIPANAQTRVQLPQPAPKPGFQAPEIDPIFQRLNEMQKELDALRESAGKQVVALHYTPQEIGGWEDNNWNNNQKRSADFCKQALGDRFGRVISYNIRMNGKFFYFGHVICETKP